MKETYIIDYKKFYNRVKQTYPFVINDLDPKPTATKFNRLPKILEQFCQVTGWSVQQIAKNKNDSLLVFIAVAGQLYNPNLYRFNERYTYGLALELSKILKVKKGRILYYDRMTRINIKTYPAIRGKIDSVYSQMA